MAIEQGGYTSNLDEIMDALGPQSGGGDFVGNYMRTPATWDAEKATGQWDVIKQGAKDVGTSVLDWLGETAFKGSQNPTGVFQETLGALSYPFAKTAEVAIDYVNPYSPGGYMHSEEMPDWLSFLNENQRLRTGLAKNPALALAPALLGGFGYPTNEWAEGRDVTKGALTGGLLSLTGPMAGLVSRSVGQVSRKIAPNLTDETVDMARRNLGKALLVASGMGAAGAGLTKAILGKTTKVGAKVATGASMAGRAMAMDALAAIHALFKAADKSLGDTGKVLAKGAHTKPVIEHRILTVGENASTMVDRIGDVKTTRSALINNMSFGTKDQAYLEFFGKINKAVETNLPPMRTPIDPDTGFPILQDRLPPALTISPKGGATLDMEAFRLISKENSELARIRTAFEQKWDLPTTGQKDYLFNGNPGPKFAGDDVAVRQFRDELNLMGFNHDASQSMTRRLDTIEIALRNIEHLEKTDPNQLRAILTKIIDDTPNFTGRTPSSTPVPGAGWADRQQQIREMAEDILEAMQ